jgi:nitroimidazol reductase NimA-like FMN-containing flavoprotein (pyridoxamine 5'-phosphate oxidase superfamily)/GNAT superfamily N-acetyltransferase
MRRAIYEGARGEGVTLLERAHVVHLATTAEDGGPILRVVHPVVIGDGAGERLLAFHGAPVGEKMEGLGRRAVVSAHEVVAEIPSWFLDPERACPATTYYVSAQVDGVLERVEDPATKAAALQAIMAKYQPEGGHVPVRSEDPLYRKAVAGLLVAGVRLARVSCKTKLGQNRTLAQRRHVVEQLWKRGGSDDVRAVHTLVRRFPELTPPFFEAEGVRLDCAVDDDELDEVFELVGGLYWLAGVPKDVVVASVRASQAVVTARDVRTGALVGFARAVSDRKVAWIYDVAVREGLRGSGTGTALMRLLLDHPAVRVARHVRLTTRDAMPFYRRLGFRDLDEAPRHPWPSTEMIRPAGQNLARSPTPPNPGPNSGTIGERASLSARFGAVK